MNVLTAGTNFNVLYSLVFNASDNLRGKLELKDTKFAVSFVCSFNSFQLASRFLYSQILPERNSETFTSFNKLDSALNALELSENTREKIYSELAAILHLGNLNFEHDNSGFAKIVAESNQSLEIAAKLLSVNPKELENVLLKRKLITSSKQKDENILYVYKIDASTLFRI